MLLNISKHSFPRMQGQLMPITGVTNGVITPEDKTKSNPLARLKVKEGILSVLCNFTTFENCMKALSK